MSGNYGSRRGSTVEQRTCNARVVGSIPTVGTIEVEGFPSGQREQTVNLSADAFGGSNPPPSTIFYYAGIAQLGEH